MEVPWIPTSDTRLGSLSCRCQPSFLSTREITHGWRGMCDLFGTVFGKRTDQDPALSSWIPCALYWCLADHSEEIRKSTSFSIKKWLVLTPPLFVCVCDSVQYASTIFVKVYHRCPISVNKLPFCPVSCIPPTLPPLMTFVNIVVVCLLGQIDIHTSSFWISK